MVNITSVNTGETFNTHTALLSKSFGRLVFCLTVYKEDLQALSMI